MKTKKIVAVQVDPEYKESPLDCDEMFPATLPFWVMTE